MNNSEKKVNNRPLSNINNINNDNNDNNIKNQKENKRKMKEECLIEVDMKKKDNNSKNKQVPQFDDNKKQLDFKGKKKIQESLKKIII